MKGKLKNLLPIAIIIGVFAIVIGIIIGVSEAHKPPKDTRIPAKFLIYYERYNSQKGEWEGEDDLLCEVTKETKSPYKVKLPFTEEKYKISFMIESDPKKEFGETDYNFERSGYMDFDGNRSNYFSEIRKRGLYSYGVEIEDGDKFIPFYVTLIIEVDNQNFQETRAPAMISVYSESYNSKVGDWVEKVFLCDIAKADSPSVKITLPYTGEEYRLSFEVKADTEELYDERDWYTQKVWYEGNGVSTSQFSEIRQKGKYIFKIGIYDANKHLIPFYTNLLIYIT